MTDALAWMRDMKNEHQKRLTPFSSWKEKIAKPPAEIPWVVESMLVRGGLTMLVSEGGLGKSWMAAHIATMVAQGGAVHGQFETRSTGNVLWYDNENGTEENDRRVQLMVPKSFSNGEHDVYMREVPNFYFKANLEGVQKLRDDIEEVKPALIVIDSVVSIFYDEKSESNSNDVREVLDALVNTTKGIDNPPAFLLLHHAKKGGSDESEWPEYRGSSDLRSAVNFLITMRGRYEGKQKYVQFKWDKSRRGKQPEGVYEYTLIDRDVENHLDPLNPHKVVEYMPSNEPMSVYDEIVQHATGVLRLEGQLLDSHLIPMIQERYPSPPTKAFIQNQLYRAVHDDGTNIARHKDLKSKSVLRYLYELK